MGRERRRALNRATFAVPAALYYALGALSNLDHYGAIAARLSRVFPDFELKALWGRAEQTDPSGR